MEHQGIQEFDDMGDEGFRDEFQCCVCLDIMYKPVVLACGHISCFWCVFNSMDFSQESHCPVCRHPYNHFPRICNLLHSLLLKLYPSAYRRRDRQVADEEKESGHASQQCDGNLIGRQYSEELDVGDSSSLLGDVRIGDHSVVQDSSKRTFPGEVNTTTIPAISSSHINTDRANSIVEHSNQILVTDLQCAICKDILFRPVVLNCGHVHCEACIVSHDNVCKCLVCQCAHPNGFPSVCLVLEHFLEERFPKEYSARKESLRNFQSASPSEASTAKQELTKSTTVPTNVCSTLPDHFTKFHPAVGCDYCGMYPIIGLRYKCKDCVEEMGFDLCEGCYNSSSKLPGRFNQQHTQEHQFVVVQPRYFRSTISSPGAQNSEEYEVVLSVPLSPNDDLDDEVGSTVSLVSSDDDSQDSDDVMASRDSSNNHWDGQDHES